MFRIRRAGRLRRSRAILLCLLSVFLIAGFTQLPDDRAPQTFTITTFGDASDQDAKGGKSAGKGDEPRVTERALDRLLTPDELRKQSLQAQRNLPDYAQQKDAAPLAGNMNDCRNADYPSGTRQKIMHRMMWCMSQDQTIYNKKCTTAGCYVIGSMTFRVSIMGQGNKGPAETDRKTEVWVQLDNFRSADQADWNAKLKIEGKCKSKTAGSSCNTRNGTSYRTLNQWRTPGNTDEWITFFSSEGSLTGDKVANHTFDLVFATTDTGVPGQETEEIWEGGPFRCDSATYVGSDRACIYDDDNPVVYRFDSRPEWKEQTEHIWKAQNDPEFTLPVSRYTKNIPGSMESKDPLTRRYNERDNKANRDKSVAQCVKFYGKAYPTSEGYARECDEYPYASTYEGSATGANDAGNDGYKHFSVEPITAGHNNKGGIDLGSFYTNDRMLDGDRFYVHLVTPAGGDYAGPHKPSGIAAPVKYSSCSASTMVEAQQAEKAAYPQDVFNKYAETTPSGWTGGDSTYSVTLPDGRRLWLFSDTFLGPLNADGTRPTSAPLINSTFVSQVGDNLETIKGGSTGSPLAIMPPPADRHWYWLGDGLVANVGGEKKLQVIFHAWHKFGDGMWDFKFSKAVVATFDLNNLKEPESIEQLPSKADVQWGAAVVPSSQSGDGYTYIYGVNDAPLNKKMRVARVKGSNIADADKWEYLNSEKSSWMYGESEGDDATVGIANEYSVTPYKGNYVLVSQDSTEGFSGKIRMWTGCDPFGPFGSWEGHDVVYRMPEPGPYGTCEDGKCFSYNAHVHPSLASGDRWTLSYNVNNFDNRVVPDGAHYRDPTIYRPRFVSFKLVSTNTLRSEAKLRYHAASPKAGAPPCRPDRPRAGTLALSTGRPCP